MLQLSQKKKFRFAAKANRQPANREPADRETADRAAGTRRNGNRESASPAPAIRGGNRRSDTSFSTEL
jgi:hypothetical protein